MLYFLTAETVQLNDSPNGRNDIQQFTAITIGEGRIKKPNTHIQREQNRIKWSEKWITRDKIKLRKRDEIGLCLGFVFQLLCDIKL